MMWSGEKCTVLWTGRLGMMDPGHLKEFFKTLLKRNGEGKVKISVSSHHQNFDEKTCIIKKELKLKVTLKMHVVESEAAAVVVVCCRQYGTLT